MTEMTKRERIQAVLANGPVDRVPVAFWRHWPGDDQHPDSLSRVALDFQRRYDLDFIKMPVSSTYCVADYGVKHAYRGRPIGDRDYIDYVIKREQDWDSIETLDVHKGTYGWHLKALRQVINKKDQNTPVIFTMFNPLSMASYLSGSETLLVHLRRYPTRVEHALSALTQTCTSFAEAAIKEGADGIFLSTRFASYELMTRDEYSRYGRPGDLAVLDAAGGAWFNVLHLHGQYPMFIELSDYPVQAINWHDRTTWPNLTEASRIFQGTLLGGVEQYEVLHFGDPSTVKAQVHDAIKQMKAQHLIVTPGCTYPLTVPDGNLIAMRRAVEETSNR